MKKFLILAGVFGILGMTTARAQGDVDISGKAMISFDMIENEAAGTTTHSSDIDFDVKFKWEAADGVKACVKLDTEDTQHGVGIADTKSLVEEAYVTVSNVGDSDISIAFGRKELKFGQDKCLWESKFGIHNWGEVDNVTALEFGIELSDNVKLYLSDWQFTEDTDATGTDPDDDFMFQSYAAKAEMTFDELTINLSYLNAHDEDAAVTDDTRTSAGLVYEKDGVSVFAEVIQLTDGGFIAGNDGQIMSFGAKFELSENASAGFLYEAQSDFAAAADNETVTEFGLSYDFDSSTSLFVEYVMHEEDNGDATNTITTGYIAKF